MKIILSRKGFDSGSGGAPSPILPDGTLVSLPIPDKSSRIRYEEISHGGWNLGNIVASLSNGRVRASYGAHLDPDLCETCVPRQLGWKPLFGQAGAAQGHLREQGIQAGDLFVFFGLFQEVMIRGSKLRIRYGTKPIHVIWGWLQVDEVVPVDGVDRERLNWALYHPHFYMPSDATNTLYIGKTGLEVTGLDLTNVPGSGRFSHFSARRRLTAEGSTKCSEWALPGWFDPSSGRPALTYHCDRRRWRRRGDQVFLKSVGRGQEFVFDMECYPEALAWVAELLRTR
jgi:hypothetical protein